MIKSCPIGELVLPISTYNPQINGNSTFEYVDISSIDRETKTIVGVSEIESQDAPSRARQLIKAGDVLISTVRPNLNAVAQVPEELDGAVASTGFTVLRPNLSKTNSRYLFNWVKSHYFVSKMVENATGASYPAVSDRIVKESKIPLPQTLDEQKRIAAVLDKADALREKRRAAITKLDQLLQSVFLDMFGDPVSNPKGWEICTIRDLISSANYGTSEKSEAIGKYPVLRMNNITYRGGWDFSSLKYSDFDGSDIEKYLVKKGELLFNRTNSKELVGKTAVFREEKPMAFAGYLIRVRANAENNTEYISAFLNSKYGKTTLLNMCKNIIGMANINAQELQNIRIPKPPTKLQNKFANVVQKVEQMKVPHQNDLQKVETLFQSLQQRAFAGELFGAAGKSEPSAGAGG